MHGYTVLENTFIAGDGEAKCRELSYNHAYNFHFGEFVLWQRHG